MNPGLLRNTTHPQVRELMTKYGNIDMILLRRRGQRICAHLAWKLQPNVVVTRGAIKTPEQTAACGPFQRPMGGKHYDERGLAIPAAESIPHKSGKQICRALSSKAVPRGGNVLLDVGPESGWIHFPAEPGGTTPPLGAVDVRQRRISIYGVRPWVITNEGDLWFTRKWGSNEF